MTYRTGPARRQRVRCHGLPPLSLNRGMGAAAAAVEGCEAIVGKGAGVVGYGRKRGAGAEWVVGIPIRRDAIALPVQNLGVEFEPGAIDTIVEFTEGYPYFLQEYGKIIWDESSGPMISRREARAVQPLVEAHLDQGFFHVRAERSTTAEIGYMTAMAELGPEAHRAGDVANRLARKSEHVSALRYRLIEKGLLYSPSHGRAAFSVPQFDRYLLRRKQP